MTNTTRACLQAALDAQAEAHAEYNAALAQLSAGTPGAGERTEAAFDALMESETTLRDMLARAETQGRAA